MTEIATGPFPSIRSAWFRPAASLAVIGALALLLASSDISFDGAAALLVFAAMMLGWVMLGLPQTPVALAGALALVLLGVADDDDLFEAFGNEIVWIMVAAFIVAAVLTLTGLAERLSLSALSHVKKVSTLFWMTTAVVAVTAFVVPSTSARAAMLLPVFLALSSAIDRPNVTKGLGLLFPSVILLSAAASLTGAGAHLVAVDFIDRGPDLDVGFLEWAAFGAPFAFVTSTLACLLVLRLFLDAEDRGAVVSAQPATAPLSAADRRVIAAVVLLVILFATESWHGFGLGVLAMVGALVTASVPVSGVGFKPALRKVDWDLLLFLAATLCVGEALLDTGAAAFLVDLALGMFGDAARASPWLIFAAAATLSALSHLVIISRTARATVLIPTLALPLAALGAEPHLVIMTSVIGSGFCQTFLVSAKPVTLFGAGEKPPFDQSDLTRLAIWTLPPFIVLLTLFAAFVWPLIPLSE
jgi:sodium-dependent dicarboxylate transporter 2/3/5